MNGNINKTYRLSCSTPLPVMYHPRASSTFTAKEDEESRSKLSKRKPDRTKTICFAQPPCALELQYRQIGFAEISDEALTRIANSKGRHIWPHSTTAGPDTSFKADMVLSVASVDIPSKVSTVSYIDGRTMSAKHEFEVSENSKYGESNSTTLLPVVLSYSRTPYGTGMIGGISTGGCSIPVPYASKVPASPIARMNEGVNDSHSKFHHYHPSDQHCPGTGGNKDPSPSQLLSAGASFFRPGQDIPVTRQEATFPGPTQELSVPLVPTSSARGTREDLENLGKDHFSRTVKSNVVNHTDNVSPCRNHSDTPTAFRDRLGQATVPPLPLARPRKLAVSRSAERALALQELQDNQDHVPSPPIPRPAAPTPSRGANAYATRHDQHSATYSPSPRAGDIPQEMRMLNQSPNYGSDSLKKNYATTSSASQEQASTGLQSQVQHRHVTEDSSIPSSTSPGPYPIPVNTDYRESHISGHDDKAFKVMPEHIHRGHIQGAQTESVRDGAGDIPPSSATNSCYTTHPPSNPSTVKSHHGAANPSQTSHQAMKAHKITATAVARCRRTTAAERAREYIELINGDRSSSDDNTCSHSSFRFKYATRPGLRERYPEAFKSCVPQAESSIYEQSILSNAARDYRRSVRIGVANLRLRKQDKGRAENINEGGDVQSIGKNFVSADTEPSHVNNIPTRVGAPKVDIGKIKTERRSAPAILHAHPPGPLNAPRTPPYPIVINNAPTSPGILFHDKKSGGHILFKRVGPAPPYPNLDTSATTIKKSKSVEDHMSHVKGKLTSLALRTRSGSSSSLNFAMKRFLTAIESSSPPLSPNTPNAPSRPRGDSASTAWIPGDDGSPIVRSEGGASETPTQTYISLDQIPSNRTIPATAAEAAQPFAGYASLDAAFAAINAHRTDLQADREIQEAMAERRKKKKSEKSKKQKPVKDLWKKVRGTFGRGVEKTEVASQ